MRTSVSVRARRRVCQAALGIGAAAALITGTSAAAFAASPPPSTQSASSTESPATVYFAYGLASAPFQLVSGGSIYASNKLEATSSPPPADCQIGVELRYVAGIISQNILESAYSGYKACSALLNKGVTTPALTCVPSPAKTAFYTTGITDLITPDGTTGSDSEDTSSVSLFCAP